LRHKFWYVNSGGTIVTVTGTNLDSVAAPRLELNVITRITNNTGRYNNTSVEVIIFIYLFICII